MKQDVTEALLAQFGAEVITLGEDIFGKGYFRGEPTFVVQPDKIVDVCQFLKETAGLNFIMLADISGIDYYQQPIETQWGRFAACYHLLSIRWNQRIRLKVFWSEGDPAIPTVTPLWKSANWEEREAYDMFGIPFAGHPDLRRLLMPDDWQGYPQRKDYPLGYETVQFSFNYDDISQHKPFAKE